MIWIRSAVFSLLMALATVFFSAVALLTFPFPPTWRYRIISQWSRLVVFFARVICGIRYEVIGAENIPNAPCVIAAKHQSAWETLALQEIFPMPLAMVVKRELLRIPFFGWGFAMLHPIAIDRSSGREALKQIVEQGQSRVRDGFSVVIYPEGTRMKPGEKGKYGIGAAWLAVHAGLDVVPVAHDAGRYWGKNAFLKYPGTITVSIAPRLSPDGMKPQELAARIETQIESEVARISARQGGPGRV